MTAEEFHENFLSEVYFHTLYVGKWKNHKCLMGQAANEAGEFFFAFPHPEDDDKALTKEAYEASMEYAEKYSVPIKVYQ